MDQQVDVQRVNWLIFECSARRLAGEKNGIRFVCQNDKNVDCCDEQFKKNYKSNQLKAESMAFVVNIISEGESKK